MRKLLIVLVVLGLLVVGADRLAVRLAEAGAASGIQHAQGLSAKPHVTIEGFPFLTQLITGKFTAISVSATGTGGSNAAQTVRITSWHARATKLQVNRDFSHVVAGSAAGSATISYADLTAAIDTSSVVGATAAYGGPTADGHGRVAITGTLTVLGQALHGTVSAELDVAGPNKLGFSAVRVEGLSVTQALVSAFSDAFTKQLTVTKLPAGLHLTTIVATPTGVTGAASGVNVILKQ